MSLALLPVALLAASALYAATSALWRRTRRRPQLPQRTPADVLADAAAHRAARDLATCRAIWPDPPSWRIADTQHRLDRRKENGT